MPDRPDRGRAPRHHPLLPVVLVCRAGVNAGFAYWLATNDLGWTHVFELASTYALVDGVLALVTTAVLVRHPGRLGAPMLIAMTFADALLLLGAGAAVRVWPGLSGFPVTIVLFYGAVGVWAVSLGAIAIMLSIRVIERDRGASRWRRVRDNALVDPIIVGGLVAMAFVAYAFFAGPPVDAARLRHVSALGAGMLSIVFLTASIGLFLRRD